MCGHPWHPPKISPNALAVSWKICLMFGLHVVDRISHKLLQECHFVLFFPGCAKLLEPWISCIFHASHKVLSACKALTKLWFVFGPIYIKVLEVC